MSKEFASPLILEFNNSRIIQLYLISIHLLATLSLLLSALMPYQKVIVIIFVVVSFLYQKNKLYRYKKLLWLKENDWVIFDALENEINVRLSSLSFSSSWLVILALRTEDNKAINLLVPFDALNKESFRLLKVKLTILKPAELMSLTDDD